MKTRVSLGLGLVLSVALAASAVSAQHKVPVREGTTNPLEPQGFAGRQLPKLPMKLDTGEGQKIRIVAVTQALEFPISMAFLPDGAILVAEHVGQLRIIRNGKLDPKPVAGAPPAYWAGVPGTPGQMGAHGYQDVALHPQFAQNHFVYLTYTKPEDPHVVALARGRWDGNALTETKDIFVLPQRSTSRIAFGQDGMIYMSTTNVNPQDPNSLGGKVLRLKDDGTVPQDNPFVGKAGYRPEVYTLGHRSILGLALQPVSGEMWASEEGPQGGDEINILKPGKNYGWPLVSYGRDYNGPWHNKDGTSGHVGFEAPTIYWMPSIAISGMTFYTGDKLPKWKGDVFVGSLQAGEIPGTGHIERILINEKYEEIRHESLLTDFHQRIRDIRQGPDGLIYVLTDHKPGTLLRIEPAQ